MFENLPFCWQLYHKFWLTYHVKTASPTDKKKKAFCKFVYKKNKTIAWNTIRAHKEGQGSSYKRLVQLTMPRFRPSLLYAGYQLWNNLADDLRMLNDFNAFKKFLNKYMYDRFCEDGFFA